MRKENILTSKFQLLVNYRINMFNPIRPIKNWDGLNKSDFFCCV